MDHEDIFWLLDRQLSSKSRENTIGWKSEKVSKKFENFQNFNFFSIFFADFLNFQIQGYTHKMHEKFQQQMFGTQIV